MKISIITVVFNRVKTIENSIQSFLSQTHPDKELVLIDGGSTDGTLEVIKKYRDQLGIFVSEKDKGIYDALNKGIRLATGDIIGILHSDDFFASENTLTWVNQTYTEEPAIDLVYGDLQYVSAQDTSHVERYWFSKAFEVGSFKKGWHPPHTTVFAKKQVFETWGLYRLDIKIASDYEWMLRLFEKAKLPSRHLPKVLTKMRSGGLSNQNFKNILKANIECYRAFKLNGLSISPLFIFIKPLSKIFQMRNLVFKKS